MIYRALLILLLFMAPLYAVEPDEVLEDPVLEQRARDLSQEIRCLVCRNEPIDSSNAQIAKDLRLLVRERLVAGDSDEEVRQYLVDRYGEFVLLKPRFTLGNALLWAAAPLLFLIGAVIAFRLPRKEVAEASLSDAEKARLEKLLNDS